MAIKNSIKVNKVGSTIDAQMILIFEILENINLDSERKNQKFNKLIAQGELGSPEFVELYMKTIQENLRKAGIPLGYSQSVRLEECLGDKTLKDKAEKRKINPSELLLEEIKGIITTKQVGNEEIEEIVATKQLENIVNTGLNLKQRTGNRFGGFEPPTYEQVKKLHEMYKENFNCFTPDGELMSGILSPDGRSFNFAGLDIISDYAKGHGIEMRGLSFVWHDNFPEGLEKIKQNEERAGKDPAEAIQDIFRSYITAYGNKGYDCYAWDILNEIAYDSKVVTEGENKGIQGRVFRDSKWTMAIPTGEERKDFLKKSDIALKKEETSNEQNRETAGERDGKPFDERDREYLALYINLLEIARESAPNEKFYINEFHLENPQKRENFLKIIRAIRTYEQATGKTLIDGVAYQCHINTDIDVHEVENAIIGLEEINEEFKKAKPNEELKRIKPLEPLDIQISELDIAHSRNEGKANEAKEEYTLKILQEENEKQAKLYTGIFDMVNRHKSISLLSLWGPADNLNFANRSYANGEMAHATLIDENYEVKSFVREYEKDSQGKAETKPKKFFTRKDLIDATKNVDRVEVSDVLHPIVSEEQKGQEQEKNVSVRRSSSIGGDGRI